MPPFNIPDFAPCHAFLAPVKNRVQMGPLAVLDVPWSSQMQTLTFTPALLQELVQMESLAQVGVQLLLFTLGLEFSLQKLRAVRSVALIGGMLEIFLFVVLAGLLAIWIGASVHEGIFVGALVSLALPP